MAIEVKFKRNTKAEINKMPLEDGAISFSTDTQEIFMDDATGRKAYGGNLNDYIKKTDVEDTLGVQTNKVISQKGLNDEFIKSREKIEQNKQNITKSLDDLNRGVSNAFVKEDFGNVITSDTVSPIEHSVKVKVKRANEIPFPYENTTVDLNGVKWVSDKNGSITISGTPLRASQFIFVNKKEFLDTEKYYKISHIGQISNAELVLELINPNGENFYLRESSGKFRISDFGSSIKLATLKVQRIANNIPVSGTFYPIIIEGDKKMEQWFPRVEDVSKSKVEVCGKNVINIEKWFEISKVPYTKEGNTYHITSCRNGYNNVYELILNKKVSISGEIVAKSAVSPAVQFRLSNGNWITAVSESRTKNVNIECTAIRLYYTTDGAFDLSDFQIELGELDTIYEPYKGTEYPVLTDGTVPNVKSISPNMTILSDTNGIAINAKYNLDGKKYVDKAFDEIKQSIVTTQALALEK